LLFLLTVLFEKGNLVEDCYRKESSVKEEQRSFGKIFFLFFFSLPYKIFCIAYFIFTFPRRLKRMRVYHAAPKVIKFRRIAERRVSALRAFDLVRGLRAKDGQEDFPRGPPSLFDLLEELWNEGMSPFWKIPTVSELESVREELISEIASSPLQMVPASRIFIWALDEHHHVFTTYCPFTEEIKDAGVPKDLGTSVLRGNAPDSQAEHFAYAVSVTVKDIHNIS
jgi:hypothetical protein